MDHLIATKPVMLASLALTMVFLIDVCTPLGIAVGVLYVFCFFLVCRQPREIILTFAIVTSFLTIAKLVFFYTPDTSYMTIVNRIISVIIIVVIAVLASRHRKLVDKIREERNAYIAELEKMLFMTSHKVRKPITTGLGLMNLVEADLPLSRDDLRKIVKNLKSCVLELDEFTKELTLFMSDTEQRRIKEEK